MSRLQALYDHALHTIFSFLALADLHHALLTCRTLRASASKPNQAQRPLSAVVGIKEGKKMFQMTRAPFNVHVGSVRLDSSVRFVTDALTHLPGMCSLTAFAGTVICPRYTKPWTQPSTALHLPNTLISLDLCLFLPPPASRLDRDNRVLFNPMAYIETASRLPRLHTFAIHLDPHARDADRLHQNHVDANWESLKHMVSLRSLRIADFLGFGCHRHLAHLGNMPALTHLDLWDGNWSADSLISLHRILAASASPPRIQWLNLSSTILFEDDRMLFDQLLKLGDLRKLALESAHIGTLLELLRHLPNVSSVYIRSGGMQWMTPMVYSDDHPLPAVRHLVLEFVDLTMDAALLNLQRQFPNLTSLELHHCEHPVDFQTSTFPSLQSLLIHDTQNAYTRQRRVLSPNMFPNLRLHTFDYAQMDVRQTYGQFVGTYGGMALPPDGRLRPPQA